VKAFLLICPASSSRVPLSRISRLCRPRWRSWTAIAPLPAPGILLAGESLRETRTGELEALAEYVTESVVNQSQSVGL
jgi:hypothetical protein